MGMSHSSLFSQTPPSEAELQQQLIKKLNQIKKIATTDAEQHAAYSELKSICTTIKADRYAKLVADSDTGYVSEDAEIRNERKIWMFLAGIGLRPKQGSFTQEIALKDTPEAVPYFVNVETATDDAEAFIEANARKVSNTAVNKRELTEICRLVYALVKCRMSEDERETQAHREGAAALVGYGKFR